MLLTLYLGTKLVYNPLVHAATGSVRQLHAQEAKSLQTCVFLFSLNKSVRQLFRQHLCFQILYVNVLVAGFGTIQCVIFVWTITWNLLLLD